MTTTGGKSWWLGSLWVLPLACALAIPSFLSAQSHLPRQLKGLKGLGVVVETLSDAGHEAGITEDRLRTITELRLRTAGLVVDSDSSPYLYVRYNLLDCEAGLCTYSYETSLNEPVTIERNGEVIVGANVWETGGVATVGKNKLARGVEDTLNQGIDKFLNAWLSVNPK
jgi:hypothetical protein